MEQTVAIVLGAVGGWLLWSPWAFVIAAVVAFVLPEIVAGRRR